jgi:zinc and cadmium transporter
MIVYALVVAALSLAGAALPLRFRPGHAQLQIYLSLAAGALLGAAMFHLLPESAEYVHAGFGLPAALGIVIVFFLQRYLAPHSHELSPHNGLGAEESSPIDELRHVHEHGEAPSGTAARSGKSHGHERERLQGAGPFLTGVIAIFALSIHSLFDGIAIGAASHSADSAGGSLILSVFLSVLIHKPMDGLSVSVLLLQAGAKRRMLWAVQLFYAALVPIGAIGFRFVEVSLPDASLYVGYTLSFSAGTFLAIALTDLLPELHFHTHDRHKLSAALLLGLSVMWVTSLIGHSDAAHKHEPTSLEAPEESDDHEH